MLIFDTVIAFAALIGLCVLFTEQCRVPVSLAPLLSVSFVMLYFSFVGVFGLLLVGGWIFYIATACLLAWLILSRKGKIRWQVFCTPGFLLFLGLGISALIVYAYNQPLFSSWDEFSFWGIAPKLLKLNHQMYSVKGAGWDWTATERPGFVVLGYFTQFFGKEFAPWKVYWGYSLLYGAAFSAVLGVFTLKNWRIAIPGGIIALLLPFLFSVFYRQVYLNKAYLSSYADLPAGILFGGTLCFYFTLKTKRDFRIWPALIPLMALCISKENVLPIALVAAVILGADSLLFQNSTKKSWKNMLAPVAGLLLSVLVSIGGWMFYATKANTMNVVTGGQQTNISALSAVLAAFSQIFGFSLKSERLAQTFADFVPAFFNGKEYPVSSAGALISAGLQKYEGNSLIQLVCRFGSSAFLLCLIIFGLFGLALFFSRPNNRGRIILAWVLSFLGFLGWMFVMLVSYGFIFKTPGLVDYSRYMSSYLAGWLMLGLYFLFTAVANREEDAGNTTQKAFPARLAPMVLCGWLCLLFSQLVPPGLSVLDYSQRLYDGQRQLEQTAKQVGKLCENSNRIFFVSSESDGESWFLYSYYLLPQMLDYSIHGGGDLYGEKGAEFTCAQLEEYLTSTQCDAIFIEKPNPLFYQYYGSLFAGTAEEFAAGPAVYLRASDGKYHLAQEITSSLHWAITGG